jgi:hypothetical protein
MQPVILTKAEDVHTAVATNKSSEPRDDTVTTQAPGSANASTTSKQEEENEDQWEDSASLYEEFLDDTEAFDYPSGDSTKFHTAMPSY